MDFRLLPKAVTLNDLDRRNGHYFRYSTDFGGFGANYKWLKLYYLQQKSSRIKESTFSNI